MSKITTDDCKKFLLNTFNDSTEKQWKRISKTKNNNGLWLRTFTNSEKNITCTLLENNEYLSLVNHFNSNDLKSTQQLIDQFFEDYQPPNPNQPGYTLIPQMFSFAFLEDANCDCEDINKYKKTNDPQIDVNNLSIFFIHERCTHHISPLISDFIPSFMTEDEESTFFIQDKNKVPLNQILNFLQEKGFTYKKNKCIFSHLNEHNKSVRIKKMKP